MFYNSVKKVTTGIQHRSQPFYDNYEKDVNESMEELNLLYQRVKN